MNIITAVPFDGVILRRYRGLYTGVGLIRPKSSVQMTLDMQ